MYHNLAMATSTLCPGATSPQFIHYDPTVPELTKSKAQAKVQERTHRADSTEEADHNSGLLHQGISLLFESASDCN